MKERGVFPVSTFLTLVASIFIPITYSQSSIEISPKGEKTGLLDNTNENGTPSVTSVSSKLSELFKNKN